jgi:hypothetical protein
MEALRNAYSILVGKPEGRDHLENLVIDGNIVLKKQNMKVRAGLNFLAVVPIGWLF